MRKVGTLVKKNDVTKLKSYYGEALSDAYFKNYVDKMLKELP